MSEAQILNPQELIANEGAMTMNPINNVGGAIKMVEIIPNNTSFSNGDNPVYNFDQQVLTFPIDTGRYAIVQSESYLELTCRVCMRQSGNAALAAGNNNRFYMKDGLWHQVANEVDTVISTAPKNAMAFIYQSEVTLNNLDYVEQDVFRHRGYETAYQSIGANNHHETWFSDGTEAMVFSLRRMVRNNGNYYTNAVPNAMTAGTTTQALLEESVMTRAEAVGDADANVAITYCVKDIILRIPLTQISRCLDPVNSNILLINSLYGQQMKINITLHENIAKILGSTDIIVEGIQNLAGNSYLAKSGIRRAVLKLCTKESLEFSQSVSQLPTIMYQLLSSQRQTKPIQSQSDTQYNIINANHQSINDIVFSVDPNDKNDADSAYLHQISGFYTGSQITTIMRQPAGFISGQNSGIQFYEFQVEIGGAPIFEKPGLKVLDRFRNITLNSMKLITKGAKSMLFDQPETQRLLFNNYLVFNTEFFRNTYDATDILADGIDGTQTMAVSTKVRLYQNDTAINANIPNVTKNLECTVYFDDLMEFQPSQRNVTQREPNVQRGAMQQE